MQGRAARYFPWLVAALVFGSTPLARTLPPQTTLLRPEASVERRLVAGEVHVYEATFEAGRRYLVELKQRGIDVVVAAVAADGRSIEVDAPTYRVGREALLLPADAAGTWRVRVSSAAPAVGPGEYRIRLLDLSNAGPVRLAAEAATTEAGRLNLEGTAETKRQAIARLGKALLHWRELDDRSQEAQTLFGLGALHIEIGEPAKAVDAYNRALPLLRAVGDRAAEAIVLGDLGLAHWRLEDNDTARGLLDRSLDLQRTLGNRYGAAITLNNLCLMSHSQGQLRTAQECYLQVLDLLRELGELRNEALVLSNLGSAYNNLGEPRLALDHHRQALALRRSTGDRKGEAQTLNNIAVVYRRVGEHQEALDHYSQALEIRRQLGDRRRQGSILSNIGYAYFSLGEQQRALVFLRQALALRREVGDLRGESITLNVIGQVKTSLGEHSEAQQLYLRSQALRHAIGDRRGEASTLNLIGQSLLATGDPTAAIERFDQALQILQSEEDRREVAEAAHYRGEAHLLLGEPERALSNLEQALSLRITAEDPHGEVHTRTALAGAQRQLGQPAAARRQVAKALAKVESLRIRVDAPDLRAVFLASQRRAYELDVDLLMDMDADEPGRGFAQQARQVSERARARSLLDVLSEAGADLSRGVDPELQKRRLELQRRLNAKATRRLMLTSRGRADEAAQLELYEVVAELDRLEGEIRRRSPRYEALAHPRPLDLAGTQRLLDGDTLLLEYFLGAERSFLWAVTSGTFEAHQLPGRSEIETAARGVARQLGTFDPRAVRIERQAARDLSELLLGPVTDLLDSQRLVVVADGALHYLPFGALPMPGAEEPPHARTRPTPLIVRHEVVHLPSASALAARRQSAEGRQPALHWAAVLADPVFDAQDPRLTGRRAQTPALAPYSSRGPAVRSEGAGGLAFDRLPSTRREASAIAELATPGEVLTALDFDADRALVLSDELRKYRIVHFATHGLIQAENPQLSGLVLSLFDRRGQAQEGFLRLRDIYSLRLAADLVVLSGCQTALGREILGEGLVGITRGFMYAGVPRVVASLWRVEDRATAELMAEFYRSMSVDGMRPAAALRAAQISILERRVWSDPYYWGAFVLQGEWR